MARLKPDAVGHYTLFYCGFRYGRKDEYVRLDQGRRVLDNEDVGTAKVAERRKAPYLQRGFSFSWDRSPFSVAEAPTRGEREGVTK